MRGIGGSWLSFENKFAGAREAHIFAGDAFDGGGIGLQVLYVVLQVLIFLVQLVDFFLHLARFHLRTMHCQDAVSAEDILQQEQGKAGDQKPIHVPTEKAVQLLSETFARIGRGCSTLFRLLFFCVPPLHLVIQACASSASFSEAAGFAASVYILTTGSVPEGRIKSHEPSSKISCKPSVRSVLAT